jgi:hypothetical protein
MYADEKGDWGASGKTPTDAVQVVVGTAAGDAEHSAKNLQLAPRIQNAEGHSISVVRVP